MSAKDNILTPPKHKKEEGKPIEPIIKRETLPVTPRQAAKAMDIDASMESVADKSILPAKVAQVGQLSPEEIQQRKVATFRKWEDEQFGLTEEERKKQEKARNIQAILATVGDGVSALANLHYTSKYAPNVKQSSALKDLQARWDKEDKERKGEAREAMSLYQQMEAVQRAEDAMRYRKERDKVADERHAAEVEYRKQKDKEDRAARAEAARVQAEQWQKTFDQKKTEHEDNLTERKRNNNMRNAQAIATAQANFAKGVRGDRLGFSDGNKNEVSIYENVWKPSMQQVYKAIIEDGAYEMTLDEKINGVKPTNIESIVKQNWTKSPKARAIMYALSKSDPATMTSEVEDGIVDYTRDWSVYMDNGGGNGNRDDLDSLFVD